MLMFIFFCSEAVAKVTFREIWLTPTNHQEVQTLQAVQNLAGCLEMQGKGGGTSQAWHETY